MGIRGCILQKGIHSRATFDHKVKKYTYSNFCPFQKHMSTVYGRKHELQIVYNFMVVLFIYQFFWAKQFNFISFSIFFVSYMPHSKSVSSQSLSFRSTCRPILILEIVWIAIFFVLRRKMEERWAFSLKFTKLFRLFSNFSSLVEFAHGIAGSFYGTVDDISDIYKK